MPLSTAHPAIVLPLCKLSKKWISTSAIIIGSISPDLEYFYHIRPKRTFGHLWAHAWWFDLLITIFVCFIFHNFIRNVLIDHLPPFLNRRFSTFKIFNWNVHFRLFFPTIIWSALIGIYSHILWDEFTHKGTIIVDAIPFLDTYLTEFLGRKIYVYNLLQHISTAVGSIIVGGVLLSFPQKENHFFRNKKWIYYWIAIFIFSCLFIALQIGINLNHLTWNLSSFTILGISSVSGFLLGVLVISILFNYFSIPDN